MSNEYELKVLQELAEQRATVLQKLRELNKPVDPLELLDSLDMNHNSIRSAIWELVDTNQISFDKKRRIIVVPQEESKTS